MLLNPLIEGEMRVAFVTLTAVGRPNPGGKVPRKRPLPEPSCRIPDVAEGAIDTNGAAPLPRASSNKGKKDKTPLVRRKSRCVALIEFYAGLKDRAVTATNRT
ncbi:hypothetical protein ABT369_27410 [Dactylosporangium sp. NPDC000244]|uniref:hypothetical protein n=1 Tax=Dactylosporangium sp. NPDC000244 TaxID=3154365 RepID=UPI00331859ED